MSPFTYVVMHLYFHLTYITFISLILLYNVIVLPTPSGVNDLITPMTKSASEKEATAVTHTSATPHTADLTMHTNLSDNNPLDSPISEDNTALDNIRLVTTAPYDTEGAVNNEGEDGDNTSNKIAISSPIKMSQAFDEVMSTQTETVASITSEYF